jgi:hypothetical protein
MNARQLLDLLNGAAKDAKEKGVQSVPIDRILYAHDVALRMIQDDEKAPPVEPEAVRLARFEAELERWNDANKHAQEWSLEMFRSVISAGESALKTCVVINGGAAVALLAFAGHVLEQQSKNISIEAVAQSMGAFVGGVFAGGIGFALRYFSQALFAEQHQKSGMTFQGLCIIAGVLSHVLFCVGGYAAYLAITGSQLINLLPAR